MFSVPCVEGITFSHESAGKSLRDTTGGWHGTLARIKFDLHSVVIRLTGHPMGTRLCWFRWSTLRFEIWGGRNWRSRGPMTGQQVYCLQCRIIFDFTGRSIPWKTILRDFSCFPVKTSGRFFFKKSDIVHNFTFILKTENEIFSNHFPIPHPMIR
jgi:hypothetical protein